jgi:hypothetical protein
MLSRATTWETFAILRPFEDRLFTDCKVNVELERYNGFLDRQSETSQRRRASLFSQSFIIGSMDYIVTFVNER